MIRKTEEKLIKIIKNNYFLFVLNNYKYEIMDYSKERGGYFVKITNILDNNYILKYMSAAEIAADIYNIIKIRKGVFSFKYLKY